MIEVGTTVNLDGDRRTVRVAYVLEGQVNLTYPAFIGVDGDLYVWDHEFDEWDRIKISLTDACRIYEVSRCL